ncbi:unnamed protein product [Closterium sp. Naga37s-1]|nr:unnamed protein product [Closterium sp. Naga37s-1]
MHCRYAWGVPLGRQEQAPNVTPKHRGEVGTIARDPVGGGDRTQKDTGYCPGADSSSPSQHQQQHAGGREEQRRQQLLHPLHSCFIPFTAASSPSQPLHPLHSFFIPFTAPAAVRGGRYERGRQQLLHPLHSSFIPFTAASSPSQHQQAARGREVGAREAAAASSPSQLLRPLHSCFIPFTATGSTTPPPLQHHSPSTAAPLPLHRSTTPPPLQHHYPSSAAPLDHFTAPAAAHAREVGVRQHKAAKAAASRPLCSSAVAHGREAASFSPTAAPLLLCSGTREGRPSLLLTLLPLLVPQFAFPSATAGLPSAPTAAATAGPTAGLSSARCPITSQHQQQHVRGR